MLAGIHKRANITSWAFCMAEPHPKRAKICVLHQHNQSQQTLLTVPRIQQSQDRTSSNSAA